MEHYWAIKKNEILTFAAIWISLEDIILILTEIYMYIYICVYFLFLDVV